MEFAVGLDLDSYLAGLFDGEGCIALVQPRKRPYDLYLRVEVHTSTPSLLLLFQNRFGGHISQRKRYAYTRKTQWVWYLNSHQAIAALEVFARCCILKRAEAALGLEFLAMLPSRPRGGRPLTEDEKAQRADIVRRREKIRAGLS